MKRTVALAVILAIILGASIIVTAQNSTEFVSFQTQLDTTQQFMLTTPVTLGIGVSQPALNQSTRADIYTYVENNPGVHFRGLCESLGLSVGRVQYHTGILVSAGVLTIFSDGKMQRFFVKGKYPMRKMKIIALLRHATRGDILKILSERKAASHGELANRLAITSQGLTWQMHHLKKEGIVNQTSNGLKLTYTINASDFSSVEELVTLIK